MIAALKPVPRILGPEHNGIVMRPEDVDAVEECDRFYQYELIAGRVLVRPLPGAAQRAATDRLGYWLLTWRDSHPQGWLLDDTLYHQLVKVGADRRMVHRAIWAGLGRQPNVDDDPPTIAVDLLPSRSADLDRECDEKRIAFASVGIPEYWSVDLFRRTMSVSRTGKDPVEELIVREDETYRTQLLPGFELPMRKLLTVADRYSQCET